MGQNFRIIRDFIRPERARAGRASKSSDLFGSDFENNFRIGPRKNVGPHISN